MFRIKNVAPADSTAAGGTGAATPPTPAAGKTEPETSLSEEKKWW